MSDQTSPCRRCGQMLGSGIRWMRRRREHICIGCEPPPSEAALEFQKHLDALRQRACPRCGGLRIQDLEGVPSCPACQPRNFQRAVGVGRDPLGLKPVNRDTRDAETRQVQEADDRKWVDHIVAIQEVEQRKKP